MRHLILFLAFVAGAFLVFVGIVYLLDSNLIGLLTGLLLIAVGLGLMVGVVVSVRRKGREMRADLMAGRDVIARWQLSAADLGAFHTLDRRRAEVDSNFRNWLSIPDTAPPEGIPIILGRDTWLIGNRLYPNAGMMFGMLANVAELEGDPGYIEIAFLGAKSGTGYLLQLARVPVPIGARSDGRAAAAHFGDSVPQQNNDQLRRYFPDYVYGLA